MNVIDSIDMPERFGALKRDKFQRYSCVGRRQEEDVASVRHPTQQRKTGAHVLGKFFYAVVVLIVAASDVAQLGIIAMAIDYLGMPPGESRGYAGMGMMVVMSVAIFVIVPGVLLALGFTVRAIHRYRYRGGGAAPVCFFGGSTLLALLLVGVVVYTG